MKSSREKLVLQKVLNKGCKGGREGGDKAQLFFHILPQDRAVLLMGLHYKGANLPSSVLAVGQNTPKAVSLILV